MSIGRHYNILEESPHSEEARSAVIFGIADPVNNNCDISDGDSVYPDGKIIEVECVCGVLECGTVGEKSYASDLSERVGAKLEGKGDCHPGIGRDVSVSME